MEVGPQSSRRVHTLLMGLYSVTQVLSTMTVAVHTSMDDHDDRWDPGSFSGAACRFLNNKIHDAKGCGCNSFACVQAELCVDNAAVVSALEAAGGVQTIITAMAFPDNNPVQADCTTALQTLQRANQVRKVQTTQPWDPEVSTLHRRNLLVL